MQATINLFLPCAVYLLTIVELIKFQINRTENPNVNKYIMHTHTHKCARTHSRPNANRWADRLMHVSIIITKRYRKVTANYQIYAYEPHKMIKLYVHWAADIRMRCLVRRRGESKNRRWRQGTHEYMLCVCLCVHGKHLWNDFIILIWYGCYLMGHHRLLLVIFYSSL